MLPLHVYSLNRSACLVIEHRCPAGRFYRNNFFVFGVASIRFVVAFVNAILVDDQQIRIYHHCLLHLLTPILRWVLLVPKLGAAFRITSRTPLLGRVWGCQCRKELMGIG